jgi:palmitoyltransferase ZDHHC4
VQIIYVVCAGGGFFVYVTVGFPHLPGPYLSSIHKYTGTILMIACYYSYYKACTVDPGYITAATKKDALKRFKFDRIMYQPKNMCKTCNFEKPARSKHCSVCDMCVEKLDHHCVWVNQCVGLRNYKYFLAFLFLHAWLCTYGTIVGFFILAGICQKNNLWNASFRSADGSVIEAGYSILF